MRKRIQTQRSASAEDGFTLIEIVIALTVFMVAVMGMVALQGASIHAATQSRRQTAAVSIARFVVTQLKSEFAGWDKVKLDPTSFPAARYPLLKGVFDNDFMGQWVQYGGDMGGDEGDFRLDEFLGHNGLPDNSAASRFCVNYLVQTLENLPESDPLGEYSVWQVRVRVSWTKEGAFLADDEWTLCDPDSVNARILTTGADSVVELTAMATRELAR